MEIQAPIERRRKLARINFMVGQTTPLNRLASSFYYEISPQTSWYVRVLLSLSDTTCISVLPCMMLFLLGIYLLMGN